MSRMCLLNLDTLFHTDSPAGAGVGRRRASYYSLILWYLAAWQVCWQYYGVSFVSMYPLA